MHNFVGNDMPQEHSDFFNGNCREETYVLHI